MSVTAVGQAAYTFTAEAFNDLVLRTHGVALVDFWAEWCPPCRIIGPAVEEAAKQMQGKALVGKVNVDEARDLAESYSISSIPTLILFKDGREVGRRTGIMNTREITGWIESVL